MSAVVKEERQRFILDAIREAGKASIPELAVRFGVSDITARRDLKELEAQGLIRRVHGGIVFPSQGHDAAPVIQRLAENRACKERIARAAADLVSDNEAVFIGSGSTTSLVARNLRERKNLQVITNALTVVNELVGTAGANLVVLGGMLRPTEFSMVGHITEQAIREIRVDKVIIGTRAIDLKAGLTNDYMPEVMTDRAILSIGSQVILVADHSKFGKVFSAFLTPVDRITTIVTDDATDSEIIEATRSQGVRVHVV